jgi:ABC-type antimicrobial peptide transport system permease subunit
VLRTLGLLPRQVRTSMFVHAASLVVAPALVGVLLGVAAGRLSFGLVTHGLGVRFVPEVPVLAAVLAVPVAVAAALLVAAYPAHLARTVRPAATLRTE